MAYQILYKISCSNHMQLMKLSIHTHMQNISILRKIWMVTHLWKCKFMQTQPLNAHAHCIHTHTNWHMYADTAVLLYAWLRRKGNAQHDLFINPSHTFHKCYINVSLVIQTQTSTCVCAHVCLDVGTSTFMLYWLK